MPTNSPTPEFGPDPSDRKTVELSLGEIQEILAAEAAYRENNASILPESPTESTREMPVAELDAKLNRQTNPYDKLEPLRGITKYRKPREPLSTRFTIAALRIGISFWQQTPQGTIERIKRIRAGDLRPPIPTRRQAISTLGGAAVLASAVVLGAQFSGSEHEQAAQSPETVSTATAKPSEGTPVFPIMPPEHSTETPTPTLTENPGTQVEAPISIPHPPITREPMPINAPRQPRASSEPSQKPHQQSNPAPAESIPKNTPNTPAEVVETSLPTASPSTKPKPTVGSEQTATPSATKAPTTSKPSEASPKPTTSPTAQNSPTKSPTSTSAAPQSSSPSVKPSSIESSSRSTTQAPSPANTKTTAATQSSPTQTPKQTTTRTSPRSSFSATSIPPAETLHPRPEKSSE